MRHANRNFAIRVSSDNNEYLQNLSFRKTNYLILLTHICTCHLTKKSKVSFSKNVNDCVKKSGKKKELKSESQSKSTKSYSELLKFEMKRFFKQNQTFSFSQLKISIFSISQLTNFMVVHFLFSIDSQKNKFEIWLLKNF